MIQDYKEPSTHAKQEAAGGGENLVMYAQTSARTGNAIPC